MLVLDAGRYRPAFDDLLPHADVAALSDDFRIPGITTAATAEAVLATGATAVVITHGPDPVEWHTRRPVVARTGVLDGTGTIDVPAVQAQDTLGAGDAFHGALTASLAHGCDLATAITRAVEVASTRVAVVGPRAWLAHISGTEAQPSSWSANPSSANPASVNPS